MTIEEKLTSFAPFADMMPGAIVVHELPDLQTVYMSSKGLKGLGLSFSELKNMGSEYHSKFFNNKDMEDYIQKIRKLLEDNDPEETFTFFHQVKLKEKEDWVWHIASSRIFHVDSKGNPTHIITVAFPVDQMKHIPNKAQRFLAENEFYRKNYQKFLSLGKRAKQVLKLVAIGKSSAEIAEELYISVDTVNTHRKIIKQKLEISTTYEFTVYAHAYDLI
ncbi:response regulator transcription factor [Salinimicrobium sp. GXAS 041]|uniref:response regulator transcription factor n=1 Tax=Salinimicrobium sp. GXAS 041 TaxID=3400806 RepID=UPI003C71D84A